MTAGAAMAGHGDEIVEIAGRRYAVDGDTAEVLSLIAADGDVGFFRASVADASRVAPRSTGSGYDGEPAGYPGADSTESVALDPTGGFTGVPLLDGRRSLRECGPLTLDALGATLLAGHRVLDFAEADDGYVTTRRPSPSAGARHPIEVLVDVRHVDGVRSGAWWFDGFRGVIRRSDVDVHEATRQVRARSAMAGEPAAVAYLVARVERTASRYQHPASLVWRDAGALAATLQFAATAHEVGSRIVSTVGLLREGLEGRGGGVDVAAVVLAGDPQTNSL